MHFDKGDGKGPTLQDEENYWQTLRLSQELEDEQLDRMFMAKAGEARHRLDILNQEKRELEMRALENHKAIAREHALLEDLTYSIHEERQNVRMVREARIQQMQAYFSAHRRRENDERARIATAALGASRCDPESTDRSQTSDIANGAEPNGVSTNGEQNGKIPTPPPIPSIPEKAPVTIITDAAGQALGPVHRIAVGGNAALLLDRAPKRVVQLRRGVHFGQHELIRLHEDKDLWIAAMIQATGEFHPPPRHCSLCAQGDGPFANCVVAEGFGTCGNCYWEKKRCVGISLEERPPPMPHHAKLLSQDDGYTNGTATPMSFSRPVSRDKSTVGSTVTDETAEEDHTPITQANLLLKHDGNVYTHPECMQGVPVEKIDPNHPYWDPSWPEIAPMVELTLESWRAKLDTALRNGQTGMKFQLGRQVNRGELIMKFLKEGNFNPYQLISKKYITQRLVSYDTVFRLADTLKNLEGFKTLDITPLEWLRQRLHELIIESGPEFNLAKIIHDFYHDRKYVDLRHANGKKSIGRPSGIKMTPKDSPNSSKMTPNAKKRKLFVSEEFPGMQQQQRPLAPTPSPQIQTHLQQEDTDASAPSTPDLAKAAKRLKERSHSKSMDTDLSYDGYTDVDDYSRDSIGKHDWALHRIKSRLNTVGTGVTQYWHWIPDDGEQVFEHQVLAEGDNFTWGIYAKPINFHLELDHIEEMRWAADTEKIIVVCKPGVVPSPDGKPRGDILAEFKRSRTKRRFLVFCRKKGIEVVKTEANLIEKAWDEYESPDVPAMAESEIA
ncbi:uncharacterized protein CTRU02_214219 [Colletotrichum truncatum]|uniref:Uncharacterized protein n=1 Tax=Colletotrichum truncatum TaxID=5467 RepID=A0ACC3YHZ6_COLTU|nr:uncharacterized protein CTRU02_11297 [Colletotrichum truncatum]KAF6786039.1 hypothetical protein CTRU02_11297 [Colletotrichum truncatum]